MAIHHDRTGETREVRGGEETGEAREIRGAGKAREVLEAEEAREAREEAEEAVEKVVKWNGDSGRKGIVVTHRIRCLPGSLLAGERPGSLPAGDGEKRIR